MHNWAFAHAHPFSLQFFEYCLRDTARSVPMTSVTTKPTIHCLPSSVTSASYLLATGSAATSHCVSTTRASTSPIPFATFSTRTQLPAQRIAAISTFGKTETRTRATRSEGWDPLLFHGYAYSPSTFSAVALPRAQHCNQVSEDLFPH